MKYIKILILFIALVAITASCNKDEESTKGEYITASIDGVQFTSTFNHVVFTNSFEPPYKLLDFTGTDDNDNTLRVTLSSYLEPGTYVLPDEDHPLLGLVYQVQSLSETGTWVASTNHEDTTGVLTITEESNSKIKGTFSFNTTVSTTNSSTNNYPKQISNGQFLIKK